MELSLRAPSLHKGDGVMFVKRVAASSSARYSGVNKYYFCVSPGTKRLAHKRLDHLMSTNKTRNELKRLERVYGKLSGPFEPSKDDQRLRDTITLKVRPGLEFEVDRKILPLVEACWKSGILVLQSDAWSSAGTVRLHFASTTFADQFLTNVFADGDLYWDSGLKTQALSNWHELEACIKVTPEDWHWEINFEFVIESLDNSKIVDAALIYLNKTRAEIDEEMKNEPSVIVRFPYEFSDLLTRRLCSKELGRPPPDGRIWDVLPDLSCFDPSYFF